MSSAFIGEFKTDDNIIYNLSCLKDLYAAQESASSSEAGLFSKPITNTMISIIEALLHEIFYRIKNHTSEGVQNIAIKVLEDVRSKTLD